MNTKRATNRRRLGWLVACTILGIAVGILLYAGLSGAEPQPQLGADGACRGSTCPTATSSASLSSDQKIEAAWNAAATKCPKNTDGTLLYKCVDFAKLFVKELAKRELSGRIITIRGFGPNIYSTRWKNENEPIATDYSYHQGVEVNGKVYDNLKFDGLPLDVWRRTFDTIIAFNPAKNETTIGPPSIVPNP